MQGKGNGGVEHCSPPNFLEHLEEIISISSFWKDLLIMYVYDYFNILMNMNLIMKCFLPSEKNMKLLIIDHKQIIIIIFFVLNH